MIDPMIYGYIKYWEDENKEMAKGATKGYEGKIKIGEARTQTVETRIGQQEHAVNKPIKTYNIVFERPAIDENRNPIRDKEIHRILRKMGKKQLKDYESGNPSEMFECELKDLENAYLCRYYNQKFSPERTEDFKMRKEQEEAVNITYDYFQNSGNKFLWNAKMRFGKCFTSYQLAKKMGWTKILIVTFKPAVSASWESDLNTHIDFQDWNNFISLKEDTLADIDQTKPYVCFGSLQDLLGKNLENDIKEKNKWIHETKWDCVIFDEYHFGAWRDNTKELIQEDEQIEINDEEVKQFNESIKTNYFLYLSGTPFRALMSGEFKDEQVFNWTYQDEQKAKNEWFGNDNPYENLPQLNLYTYRLDSDITENIKNSFTNEFDLNVFFGTKGKKNNAIFEYQTAVEKWLDLISGLRKKDLIEDILKVSKNLSLFPFEDNNLRDQLNHTLWFLPNVASCYAMYNLLQKHSFFKDYTIIIAAGDECGCGAGALEPVEEAITNNPLKTKTITLSCGKLTTGVTVKAWTGILILRNIGAPETYFQAAFRVQSPWNSQYKKDCFIFDFAPDRALEHIKTYCDKLDPKGEKDPKEKLEEFIKFLPILLYNGATMEKMNVEKILDKVLDQYLHKKWDNLSLLNNINIIDNSIINNLLTIQGDKLQVGNDNDINKSNALKNVIKSNTSNNSNDTNLNDNSESKQKNNIEELKKKLQLLTSRLPNYLYLSNKEEKCVANIIEDNEPELFEKITGCTIIDFKTMVTLGVFNNNMLNCMIYNFYQITKMYDNNY